MGKADTGRRFSAKLVGGLLLLLLLLLMLLVAGAFWYARSGSTQARPGVVPAARSGIGIGAQLSGRVVLSAALQARVQPEDTVLIVARVLDGPRMPVAVLKRRASELPLDFTLDDSAATTPTLRLSPSMQLVVAARILRAGQAVAQPGDLQGISLPVPVGSRGLLVEINSVVQ